MVIRRRLLFWLIKAYIKKWGKQIILFFFIGLLVFFALLKAIQWMVPKIPIGESETVGIVGSYVLENLPSIVLADLSSGLTKISDSGKVEPAIAKSWEIRDEGKTYIFHLNNNVYYNDQNNVTSDRISYSFQDVVIERPERYTIVFKLKEPYSPFLITASRPIFKKGFIGTGEYKVKDIELNGNFVQSLTLNLAKNQYVIKKYNFYPSIEALKLAYTLGEINYAYGLTSNEFKKYTFEEFPNTTVKKRTDYSQLVTIFFNINDQIVSDKKIRNSLSYALPDSFQYGERAYTFYSPTFWTYTDLYNKTQNTERAKNLLSETQTATSGAKLVITLKTLPKYQKTAELVKKAWKDVGVETIIKSTESIPTTFQVFLGDFFVPKDPDQYPLWHSNHESNITKYRNLRIDKYLEDGRKIVDPNERRDIYLDLQKYLMDDSPAAFLYFPYEYDISRK